MTKPESKYDVAKQWSAGFSASLLPAARSLSESDHWLSGWDAGYSFREAKNKRMNEYLVSVGHESMATLRATST